jgi:putative transcriptional regulator
LTHVPPASHHNDLTQSKNFTPTVANKTHWPGEVGVVGSYQKRSAFFFKPETSCSMSIEDTMTRASTQDWSRFDALTDAEVHAAAMNDPDAQPLTEERLARMKRVPRAKTLRRAMGLTQEEFSSQFQIPVGTLRDWEQGRAEPDQTARAYLPAPI